MLNANSILTSTLNSSNKKCKVSLVNNAREEVEFCTERALASDMSVLCISKKGL